MSDLAIPEIKRRFAVGFNYSAGYHSRMTRHYAHLAKMRDVVNRRFASSEIGLAEAKRIFGDIEKASEEHMNRPATMLGYLFSDDP